MKTHREKLEEYYPALDNNPWTFIAPVLKHKVKGDAPTIAQVDGRNLLGTNGLAIPSTRDGMKDFNDEYVVNMLDSSRWNYELRVYLDIGDWMPLFFSDKWGDINTTLRMLNDNLPRKFDISGDWWMRSPKMGDGTRIDLYLQGTFIAGRVIVQPSPAIENQQILLMPKADRRTDDEVLGDSCFWDNY